MALQGINSQDPVIAVGRINRTGENPHPCRFGLDRACHQSVRPRP
jgi:hypothetical protein